MKYILFISLLIFVFACKKAEDRSCWKSSGEKSEISVDLPEFSKLRLLKNIEFNLVQDDSTYMLISGGKNLLNFIQFRESEVGEIEISNANNCNFLRDLSSKIHVEVHFKDLTDITFIGSEKLTNTDTLNFQNLYVLLNECSGTVDLTLKANYLNCENSEGYSNYIFRGKATSARFEIRANAYADCSEFLVQANLSVFNKSVGDIYVNATNTILDGYISGNGNIYYKGTPLQNTLKSYAKGSVIPY